MSYQVLARKWRPSNFSEVAGQAHVLKSLINALDNERLHHAYLFTGTRGVGKTTLARILAKCLNCEEGISSEPCGKCDSCVEINDGRFIDLMEVDAASRTKVEDTRELLENVQYTPARGRFKVYLIDEVHMLSNHSFNALLKTLEEPPPHVKFLFATTDPQKLPITILSRCLQFNLKNLSPKMISDYLIEVLTQEKVTFDEEALWQIAAAAGGSMRDALTLVDQAISFCEGSVKAAGVVDMLGVPEQQQVFDLARNMAGGNVEPVLQLVALIAEQTPDYAHTLDSLLSLWHRVAIAQVMPDAIDNSFGDKEKVIELAAQISAEDVQLYFQVGSKGREELRFSADIRSTFEMLLLRMMVFSPTYFAREKAEPTATAGGDLSHSNSESEKKKNLKPSSPSELTSNVSDSETKTLDTIDTPSGEFDLDEVNSSNSQVLASGLDAVDATVSVTNGSDVSASQAEASVAPASDTLEEQSVAEKEANQLEPVQLAQSGAEETLTNSQPNTVLSRSQLPATLENLDHQYWMSNFVDIPVTGIVANVLANTQVIGVDKNIVRLRLDINQSAVFGEELIAKISNSLTHWLNETVEVSVEIAEVDGETPALLAQRLRAEKHAEMVSGFEKDETVQELLTRFSGTLLQDSINAVVEKENGKGER